MPVSNDNQNEDKELRRSLLEASEIDQREPEQPDNRLKTEDIQGEIDHSEIQEETENSSNQGAAEANDNRLRIDETSDYQWEFDFHNNPGDTDLVKKIQCTYYYWRKDFKNTEKHASSVNNDIKESWTDIYALVGFFSVFQGVLFQSAAQLTTSQSCKFSIVPGTLSVVGSAASIAAAWYKLLEVQEYHEVYIEAIKRSKFLQTRTRLCRKAVGEGEQVDKINFDVIEQETKDVVNSKAYRDIIEKPLRNTRFIRYFLLSVLFVFAFLLAGSIFSLICDDYF